MHISQIWALPASQVIALLRNRGRDDHRRSWCSACLWAAGHARALLGLDDTDEQESLAHKIVAEGLSVRATEELVALTVSDGGTARKNQPAQRRAKPHAPALTDLADRLSDRFDTRVRVDIGRRTTLRRL